MRLSFFKKKKKEVKFNIYETSDTETSYKYTIKDVQNRNIDAIICRNFIDKEKCNTITNRLFSGEKFKNDNKEIIFTEPQSIVAEDLDSLITDNYRSFVTTFKEVYKVDLINKISSLLSKLNNNKKPKQLVMNKSDLISSGGFRVMFPTIPSLFLHCGNQFNKVFPTNYNFLSTQVEVYNHLSYFVVLKEPDEGGRLIIYDISWKEAQESIFRTSTIITLEGKKFNLDKKRSRIKNLKLDLKIGDLLIFSGGEIWHKVEDVKGKKERVTFGGFLGFGNLSETEDDLYVWT